LENPKARMLLAISATCASECVRALRAEGSGRSIGHISNRRDCRLAEVVVLSYPSPLPEEKNISNSAELRASLPAGRTLKRL
jgi:hypothetical protein